MINLTNITKTFLQGTAEIKVLDNLSLAITEGEKVAIIGASGSGKSTFLSILSGMDKPDTGSVKIDGENIVEVSEERLCQIRNNEIGIVFQAFELVPSFTALENVLLPLDIAGNTDIEKAKELLTELGLGSRFDHLPKMLSGGEQQRVAIARAIIANPKLILADEPTGNLDSQTGAKVLEVLFSLIKKYNKTFVLITHDLELAKKMDTVYLLKDGKLEQYDI